MTVRSAIVASLFSAILLISPVLAVNSQQRLDEKNQRIENRTQNLQIKLASKEAQLAQRLETLKERIASKQAELKAKLNQFRDQKKATAAARISENLNRINDKKTEQMLKHLSRMSTILDKLEARVNQGKPDIKDPTKAKDAITSARGTIASASAAVATQAEKDYTLTATSEAKIKTEAKAMRDQLHADLQAVRKLVIAAKQAVSNAIRVAKSGKLEIPGKEATESGE